MLVWTFCWFSISDLVANHVLVLMSSLDVPPLGWLHQVLEGADLIDSI